MTRVVLDPTGERTVATTRPEPRGVLVDGQMDDDRAIARKETRGLDHSAAEGDHGRLRTRECLAHEPCLDLAERSLALPSEELRDRAVFLSDCLVDVHERPAQPVRSPLTDGRLAGSHEADERDVLV